MKTPILSILIPSIPSRLNMLSSLLKKIDDNLGSRRKDVEILVVIDNKQKSIGEKRDNLLQICTGTYFMFLDDDDDFTDLICILDAVEDSSVDVITFKSVCKNNNGSEFIVTHRLGNPIEHISDENGNYLDCNRPPFHNCVWHNRYKKFHFPFVSYGEDWGWLKQFVGKASSEIHIDKVIYKYNFDPKITEASTETNSEWSNPN